MAQGRLNPLPSRGKTKEGVKRALRVCFATVKREEKLAMTKIRESILTIPNL